MKKLALLLTILIAFGTVCFAFEITEETLSIEGLEVLKNSVNEKADQTPGIGSFLGSERMNLELEKEDGSSAIIGLENKNGRIEGIKSGGVENPTLTTRIPQKTIDKIMGSEDPFQGAIDAINTGEIEFEASGFWAKIKVFFIKLGMKIAGIIKKIAELASKK